jgi:hypothetical protein
MVKNTAANLRFIVGHLFTLSLNGDSFDELLYLKRLAA